VDEWMWVDVRAYNTLPVHQRGTTGGCTVFPVLAGELSDKELCTHRPNQFGEQWDFKRRDAVDLEHRKDSHCRSKQRVVIRSGKPLALLA
jgi:hypothetical protein